MQFEKNKIFAAMQFKDNDDVYDVIKEYCEEFQLNVIRVDEEVNGGAIINDIHRNIEEAEFILVDLSYENPNVYYELGYADGLDNAEHDIFLIAKEGSELLFDIRHRRVHLYKDAYALQKLLKEKFSQFIDESRKYYKKEEL